MRTRVRISIVWMAALFVLMGSAFSFAATGTKHDNKAPKVEQSDDQNENETPEANETPEPKETEAPDNSAHERKHNHGFFVSGAAHCENVDDPDTAQNPDFTAPANCKDDGKAHGEYVRSVAKSSIGKKDKGH